MKILIADDHWVVRESLKQVLRGLRQSLELFEAETFNEAQATLEAHPDVDLLLVDLVMPGFSDFDGLRRLRASFPDVPVVVISVHEDVDHVMRSLGHGVIGYIPKSSGGQEIERALERVLEGEVSFPRRIIERSGSAVASSATPSYVQLPSERVALERDPSVLTDRQKDILLLLGQGYSVKRIASELELSSHTVRVHLGNIMKGLNMRDRAEAVHYAIRHFGPLAARDRG
ncbi:response regulator transcription factor [Methylobacterium sp. Leaf91]|uniref:response regulator n=1 Tax=Methylobacterium sp. Leaf91 TaxID=1736247 RepID=UPI0006F21450|nr:response regulator transcription factor [Methylobacterium sp. Leaf91]KQO89516.1 two-component system response regulator [Methylobacterium sp. Leaf91]